MQTRRAAISALPLAALLVTGCGGGDDESLPVDAATLGVDEAEWPLTAAEATVQCIPGKQLVIEIGNTQYALNGLAKQTGDYSPLEDVWKDDPDVEGLKVDMGDLTTWANEQCGF